MDCKYLWYCQRVSVGSLSITQHAWQAFAATSAAFKNRYSFYNANGLKIILKEHTAKGFLKLVQYVHFHFIASSVEKNWWALCIRRFQHTNFVLHIVLNFANLTAHHCRNGSCRYVWALHGNLGPASVKTVTFAPRIFRPSYGPGLYEQAALVNSQLHFPNFCNLRDIYVRQNGFKTYLSYFY